MLTDDNIASVRIYPPIGIARVGNSKDGQFYGPEIPGHLKTPQGGFKDAEGAVKRQAARFRVYAFDRSGEVLGELNASSGFELRWFVQVANKKASWYTFMGRTEEGAFQPGYTTLRNPSVQPSLPPDERDRLIVDSGIQMTSGKNADPVELSGNFYGSKTTPTPVYLGEVRTDEAGRLVVLAGRGLSRSIADPEQPYPLIMTDFDSADWIDDTCDGWIDVRVRNLGTGRRYEPASKARVIGTTPKFANGIYAPTTLFDLMEDVYEQVKRSQPGYDVGEIEWYRDIWPLLQRPALLSWVNGKANGGHGPNGPGNFFDVKWQEALSIRSKDNDDTRREVPGRLRLPDNNEKYKQARAGQAYPYFMPELSGDGGRTTAGDPSTFASITELQYDRLVKWSRGEFKKDEPNSRLSPPTCIEDIPIDEQPAALARAALDATIGAPLYPGIEMSWNAQLPETYDLSRPFKGGLNLVINDSVKQGDLTKFLSLPWQSDFYMCRSYWWPSVRPDAIVREADYKRVAKSVSPPDVARHLTTRVPWERGLHQNYTDQYSDQPLFANTDMAQNWHRLGFIVKAPSSGPTPIFVEIQRGKIQHKADLHTQDADAFKPSQPGHGYGIKLPLPDSKDEPIASIESLRTHLQRAMVIELATIPIYLYGMYSIKIPKQFVNDPRYDDPIIRAVRGVVAEEMLHLSLAGNILLAVGGQPKLYDPKYIPAYPMLMPGRIPDLTLDLQQLTKENLETFIQVERPEDSSKPEGDEYKSLAQFYAAIREGLKHLAEKCSNLFKPETAPYQFAPGLGYQPRIRDAGGSVVVTDLDSALKAINIIVVQGEGADGGPYDDKDKLEKDHYDVFRDLKNGTSKWDVYPVRSNPKTYQYEDTGIYYVSLTFDAAYCYLLLTIEKLWTIRTDDSRHKLVLGNMFSIMMGVLAPLAKFLVQQPLGKAGVNAGPCFSYYEFDKKKSALKQVQEEMQKAIDAYVDVTAETPDQVPVHDYGGLLEALLPIQVTVKGLLDIDTFTRLTEPVPVRKQPGAHNTGAKGFARGF